VKQRVWETDPVADLDKDAHAQLGVTRRVIVVLAARRQQAGALTRCEVPAPRQRQPL
jgi:hypothetical protein